MATDTHWDVNIFPLLCGHHYYYQCAWAIFFYRCHNDIPVSHGRMAMALLAKLTIRHVLTFIGLFPQNEHVTKFIFSSIDEMLLFFAFSVSSALFPLLQAHEKKRKTDRERERESEPWQTQTICRYVVQILSWYRPQQITSAYQPSRSSTFRCYLHQILFDPIKRPKPFAWCTHTRAHRHICISALSSSRCLL